MIVRQAIVSDFDIMNELVREFFTANDFAHFGLKINTKCVEQLVEKLSVDHLMLLLETDDKKVVGGLGGIITPFLLNDRIKLFQEIFYYVKDDFRKHSYLLLVELKNVCKTMRLDRIIMAHINDGTLKQMERLYGIKGFKKLETHFIARV